MAEFIKTPDGRYIPAGLIHRYGTNTFFPQEEFLPFEEVREFVRKLELRGKEEWYNYCRSGKKPDNIPYSSSIFYKDKGWIGWGDFLGTGNICNRDRIFLPFKDAKEFVISLGLKGQKEWHKYCKLDKRPSNIHSGPDRFYKDKGWISWGDWLGTESVHQKDFLLFEKARGFVRKLKLKNFTEWGEYCKSGKRPDDIPSSPITIYKNNGWIGMWDFLGVEKKYDFLPFEEARELVRKLDIKNQREWNNYSISEKRSNNIPGSPYKVYKNKWISWGDWFGTGYVAPQNRIFLSFEKARKFVRNLKLKDYEEWCAYRKSGKRPDNIPSSPNSAYKKEWTNLGDWLGTGRSRGGWCSFKEAREFARNLGLKSIREWEEYCKPGKKPNNIPMNLRKVYKEEWTNWGDFLGTGRVSNFEKNKNFLLFEEAREFVRKLKLKSRKEWIEYRKSGKNPDGIPFSCNKTYKDKGWISWPDFLGTKK